MKKEPKPRIEWEGEMLTEAQIRHKQRKRALAANESLLMDLFLAEKAEIEQAICSVTDTEDLLRAQGSFYTIRRLIEGLQRETQKKGITVQ